MLVRAAPDDRTVNDIAYDRAKSRANRHTVRIK
jgi:hypothetical protein